MRESEDSDDVSDREISNHVDSCPQAVRTILRRYGDPGTLTEMAPKRTMDLPDTGLIAVSITTWRAKAGSKAIRQKASFERFDVFIPDKATTDSHKFRFQDPTKIRSNKALNAMQTSWKNITILLPTNVSSP